MRLPPAGQPSKVPLEESEKFSKVRDYRQWNLSAQTNRYDLFTLIFSFKYTPHFGQNCKLPQDKENVDTSVLIILDNGIS